VTGTAAPTPLPSLAEDQRDREDEEEGEEEEDGAAYENHDVIKQIREEEEEDTKKRGTLEKADSSHGGRSSDKDSGRVSLASSGRSTPSAAKESLVKSEKHKSLGNLQIQPALPDEPM